jgi:hypothetical protein
MPPDPDRAVRVAGLFLLKAIINGRLRRGSSTWRDIVRW